MRASLSLALVSLAIASLTVSALGQPDRRDRQYPELILETGGRTATCDVLKFTPDGTQLLATGDDKVVRTWKVTDGGLQRDRVLYWPSWREQRGSIYCMALSSDTKKLALGGWGLRPGVVAKLDATTGKVDAALKEPQDDQVNWSITFTPNGEQIVFGSEVGKIFLWTPGQDKPVLLGQHKLPPELPNEKPHNRVRLLTFLKDGQLLSVAESGEVLTWKELASGKGREDLAALDMGKDVRLYRAQLSPDKEWVAAAATNSARVGLRPLKDLGKKTRDIILKAGEHPRSIAFDQTGKFLAVGIGHEVEKAKPYFIGGDDRVVVYDLTEQQPQEVAKFPVTYFAEALAFHPDGKRLAVAGGADHEVTLWDVTQPAKQPNISKGLGTCLWSVGLSKDDQFLGFRDQRDPQPGDPNIRGQGPWKVFNLVQRKMVDTKDFEPLKPLEALPGWKVVPDEGQSGKPADPYAWYVLDPQGNKLLLPIDKTKDQMPQCFTFLKGNPPRLVVGHYWGLSVFDLEPGRVRRSRLCTGHQGLVTSVAASADGSWLVSASRDQTIAAWSMNNWQFQSELGADFEVKDGRLFVKNIDPTGGPAWEAGLVKGEEVLTLVVEKQMVYNSEPFTLLGKTYPRMMVPAETARQKLENPQPGQELYFRVKRGGEPVEISTTLRQRPLWKFFPTRNGDWVMWMWRHPYYDTSTNGDSFVRWLVNDRDMDKEPTFYKLEQFRDLYHQRDVIDALLKKREVIPALGNRKTPTFNQIEPASVRITAGPDEEKAKGVNLKDRIIDLKDKDIDLKLVANPRGQNPDHLPQRVELWLNDYRLKTWEAGGKSFEQPFTVKKELFRADRNELTLQVYTRSQGRELRSEETRIVMNPKPVAKRRLFGLFVGIGDYRSSSLDNNEKLTNLQCTINDATRLKEAWEKQKGEGQYFAPQEKKDDPDFILLVKKVGEPDITQKDILKGLDRLIEKSGPDDVVLLFLAGHGDLNGPEGEGKSFIFCPSDFQLKKPEETGLTSKLLAEKLSRIKGHKVVLLDTCRSAGFLNPIRILTPGGKGPTIFAACGINQESYEHPALDHGLFSFALLEALTKDIIAQPGETISAEKLRDYLEETVPELAQKLKKASQTPDFFPAELPDVKLAQRPKKESKDK